jgi:hypothetical protein
MALVAFAQGTRFHRRSRVVRADTSPPRKRGRQKGQQSWRNPLLVGHDSSLARGLVFIVASASFEELTHHAQAEIAQQSIQLVGVTIRTISGRFSANGRAAFVRQDRTGPASEDVVASP